MKKHLKTVFRMTDFSSGSICLLRVTQNYKGDYQSQLALEKPVEKRAGFFLQGRQSFLPLPELFPFHHLLQSLATGARDLGEEQATG